MINIVPTLITLPCFSVSIPMLIGTRPTCTGFSILERSGSFRPKIIMFCCLSPSVAWFHQDFRQDIWHMTNVLFKTQFFYKVSGFRIIPHSNFGVPRLLPAIISLPPHSPSTSCAAYVGCRVAQLIWSRRSMSVADAADLNDGGPPKTTNSWIVFDLQYQKCQCSPIITV